jgi:hypothetical protein
MDSGLRSLEDAIAKGNIVDEIYYIPLDSEQENLDDRFFYFGLIDNLLPCSKFPNTFVNDPNLKGKFVITVRKPTEKRKYTISTVDYSCIERALNNKAYQKETVEIEIYLDCNALGGAIHDQIFPISNIISKLNGYMDWIFTEASDNPMSEVYGKEPTNSFSVKKRLKTNNIELAKEELQRLRNLLDFIAITRQIGIRVERYGLINIPRFGATFGVAGPTEWNIPPMSQKELSDFDRFLTLSPETQSLAAELNQIYLLTALPNRLVLLCTTIEKNFRGEASLLLETKEKKDIFRLLDKEFSKSIDAKRLTQLKEAISTRKNITGNQVIASKIALELGFSEDETYNKLSEAFRTRGKYVHNLVYTDSEVFEAVQYLLNLIESILKNRLKETASKQ